MNIDRYCRRIRFPLVPPGQAWPGGAGAKAMLFKIMGHLAPADWWNAWLPGGWRMRWRLRALRWTPRMSTFAIGALINRIVRSMPLERSFVNVGVWNGFTFLAGLADNQDRHCVGIDNFSQFGGPREAFLERFETLRNPVRHTFHDMDYEEYFAHTHSGTIGLYIYDGDHSREHQRRGLEVAEPYLAPGSVILIDDTNDPGPRGGTFDFLSASPFRYRVLFDMTTAGNCHPSLWNGLMLLERLP